MFRAAKVAEAWVKSQRLKNSMDLSQCTTLKLYKAAKNC